MQIAVLVVSTTGHVPIADHSLEVVEGWGGGARGRDDGVLLLLAVRDREARLEVGYGLEAHLPDTLAGAILDDMRPALRQRSYGLALSKAGDRVIAATADLKAGEALTVWCGELLHIWFIALVLLGIVVFFVFRRLTAHDITGVGYLDDAQFDVWLVEQAQAERKKLLMAAAFGLGIPVVLVPIFGFPTPGWVFAFPFWLGVFNGWIIEKSAIFAVVAGISVVVILVAGSDPVAAGAVVDGVGQLSLYYGAASIGTVLVGLFAMAKAGGNGNFGYGRGGGSSSWSGSSRSGSSGSNSSSGSSSSISSWSGGGGGFGGGGASSSWQACWGSRVGRRSVVSCGYLVAVGILDAVWGGRGARCGVVCHARARVTFK